MFKSFQKVLDVFIFYNLYIAFGATFLAYSTFFLFQQEASTPIQLLIFVFSATMLTYNIDREQNYRDYPIFIFLNFLSLFLVVYTFIQFPRAAQKYLIHIILISGLYAIPRILGKISHFSLRHVPWLKVFLIAYVWAVVTAELPILILRKEIIYPFYDFLFWERFIFFLAITLPFDIGDLPEDKERGVKTLAMLLGIQNIKIISIGLIFIFWLLIYLNYPLSYFLMQGLLVAWVVGSILPINLTISPLYYRRMLDGSILIYAFLNMLFI